MQEGSGMRRGRGRGRGGRGGGWGGDDRRCFHCGQPGHLARNCASFNPSSSNTTNTTTTTTSTTNTTTSTTNTTTSTTNTTTEPSEPLPKYIDTHAHIDYILQKTKHNSFAEFQLAHPFPSNYEGTIAIYCDSAAFSPSLSTWQEQLQQDNVYGVFGMHPHNAKYYNDQVEERIVEALKHPKAVAWGETGLDYKVMNSDKDTQKQVFARQILRAVELNKPLVVHSRDAGDDTHKILLDLLPTNHSVHVHCFTDGPEVALKSIADFPNLFFGFTGVVTYKDEELRGIVRDIVPLDRILLETDAPYMIPKGAQGVRGANHPGNIPHVAQEIANLKGVSVREVLEAARANTKRCYGI